MGCDIHTLVEIRQPSPHGKWEALMTPVFPYEYFDHSRPISQWNQPFTHRPYEVRNYAVFAVLADVRNSHSLTPMSVPRGIPQDASEVWREECKDVDYHSHTWFTVQELVDAREAGFFSHEEVPFGLLCSHFVDVTIPALIAQAPRDFVATGEPDLDAIRLVMAFDN